MKKTRRCTFRIPDDLLKKLDLIAECEKTTKIDKIRQLIGEAVETFEKEHGKIPTDPSV